MIDSLRLLAELHGHLGWLAAAALVHPAILLRDQAKWLVRGRGGAWRVKHSLSIALACGLVTAAASAGALVYGPYREKVRPFLFESAPLVGWMFERKEHLALGAAVFAWVGVFAALAARSSGEDEARRLRLGRAAHRAFVAAAALTVVTACLGTWVASVRSF